VVIRAADVRRPVLVLVVVLVAGWPAAARTDASKRGFMPNLSRRRHQTPPFRIAPRRRRTSAVGFRLTSGAPRLLAERLLHVSGIPGRPRLAARRIGSCGVAPSLPGAAPRRCWTGRGLQRRWHVLSARPKPAPVTDSWCSSRFVAPSITRSRRCGGPRPRNFGRFGPAQDVRPGPRRTSRMREEGHDGTQCANGVNRASRWWPPRRRRLDGRGRTGMKRAACTVEPPAETLEAPRSAPAATRREPRADAAHPDLSRLTSPAIDSVGR